MRDQTPPCHAIPWMGNRAHPSDVLIAPSETGAAVGYRLSKAYRLLLQAALDVARQRDAEAARLREQMSALREELRRVRTVGRTT